MDNSIFSPMEIDAIGEIMNISLGSSATAVSNMLDHRVDITTPTVTVIDPADLSLGVLDPAVGVEIRYISGLEGSNIMLLKRSDVKAIVDILMGSDTPDEEFELNELTISAVCEVMNQMMGAASTALSDFLGRMVNISPPQSFELDNFNAFKNEHFPPAGGKLVVVCFMLSIEGFLNSEFINVISADLAKELISGFGLDGVELSAPEPARLAATNSSGALSQEEIERLMGGAMPAPEPSPDSHGGTLSQEEIERLLSGPMPPLPDPEPEPASSGGIMSQDEIERLLQAPAQENTTVPAPPPQAQTATAPPYPGYPPAGAYPPPYGQPMSGYYPPPGYYYPQGSIREPLDPKVISTQPVSLPYMDATAQLGEEQAQNLDLIMSVPLELSVEIGRTQRRVQEILSLSKGSLVVLDKLAGDQVDLFVNGQCIARGDVVVIDDNFGIRITEILKPPEASELLSL